MFPLQAATMRGIAARDSILVMVSLFSQWQHAFPMIPKNSTPRSTEYIKRIMRFSRAGNRDVRFV